MRRIIFLSVMFCVSCAYADIQEFENFSLDIPEGWTAREEGSIVTVTDYDTTASLTITTDKPGENTIEELASDFSREVGGSIPESDDEGNFTFEFNGGRSQAIIAGDEDYYMLIIGTDIGDSEALSEILDSLEMK